MTRLRRAWLLLAFVSAAWGYTALATGGARFHVGGTRISATSGTRPLVAGLAFAAIAIALAPGGSRRQTIAADLRSLTGPFVRVGRRRHLAPAVGVVRRLAPSYPLIVAAAAAVVVVITGFAEGARVAGASDPYGYVSQAHLWATGSLRVPEPMIHELADVAPPEAFAPLGWRPNGRGDAIVPTYSPGLPIVMGLFERIGGRDAVFVVVPLLGGLAVWATFLLGRSVWGPATGASGALLLATSPAFLIQLTAQPMSDVPATAWWALALALVTVDSTTAVLAAGVAACAAILTRPNLAPLALAPAALLVWPMFRERRFDTRIAVRCLLFAVSVLAAAAAIAAINTYWYGSPLTSGYGNLGALFSWQHWSTNAVSYPRWLVEVHTPLIALAFAAPFLADTHPAIRARLGAVGPPAMIFGVIGIVCLSYLFYMPFGSWWDLRFILPAFPALLLAMSASILTLAQRFDAGLRAPLTIAIIALLACHGLNVSRDRSAFDTAKERTFAFAGRYIATDLPEHAVLLAMLHSGSARLYSGRQTIRWDMLDPARLDQLLERLRARGNEPYLLLDAFEVDDFRRRFETTDRFGALDWTPIAELPAGAVRIYALGRTVAEPPDGMPTVVIRTD